MDVNYIYENNLDEKQKKAYKLLCLWEEIFKKELPKYFKSKNNKDVKKSYLFKCCMKLVNETNGILDEDLYRYYIYAQITTLKNYSDGKVHALISPEILFGNNAWIRWKIFKNKLEKIKKEKQLQEINQDISKNDSEIYNKLNKTKEFFESKNFVLTLDNIIEKINDLKKWVSFNKVSVYFVIFSKTINSKYNLYKDFGIEIELYKNDIRKSAYEQFKKVFGKDI